MFKKTADLAKEGTPYQRECKYSEVLGTTLMLLENHSVYARLSISASGKNSHVSSPQQNPQAPQFLLTHGAMHTLHTLQCNSLCIGKSEQITDSLNGTGKGFLHAGLDDKTSDK